MADRTRTDFRSTWCDPKAWEVLEVSLRNECGISLCILFVLSKMGVVDAISQSQEKLLLSFATEKEKLMLEKAESCGRRRRPSTEETCGGSIVGSSAGCVCVLWCQVIVGSRCGGCLKSLLLRVFNCFHLRRFVGMAT
ncbi:unnamed protein product [Durusdinium trenchii]|uniref:Uncharacterized protein n=1 Tax=Durusdinium trenchii TaxID=1381693 RepID=A0ABP0JEP9_9DINO